MSWSLNINGFISQPDLFALSAYLIYFKELKIYTIESHRMEWKKEFITKKNQKSCFFFFLDLSQPPNLAEFNSNFDTSWLAGENEEVLNMLLNENEYFYT